MHESLYGAPGKASQSGGAVAEKLLFGLTLHASRREAQGMTLSNFERHLCQMFRTVIQGDDEAAEYSGMFAETRETMRKNKSQATLPQQIIGLSENHSYTEEDLRRDVLSLAHEIAAQPNYQIIDLAKQKTDDDGEEFAAAARAAGGRGVSYYTNTGPGVRGSRLAGNITLRMDRFYCVRSYGDSLFAPRQEIYWATAAGSDGNEKDHQVTGEYGSVNTGTWKTIRDNESTLFFGSIRECLSCEIECWEADNSSSSWLSGLRGVMRDMGDRCIRAATMSDVQDRATAVIALLGIAGKAIDELLRLITNEDDFVERRSIAWDRDALNALYNLPSGEDWWQFRNSHNGHYKLWLKVSSDSDHSDLVDPIHEGHEGGHI